MHYNRNPVLMYTFRLKSLEFFAKGAADYKSELVEAMARLIIQPYWEILSIKCVEKRYC